MVAVNEEGRRLHTRYAKLVFVRDLGSSVHQSPKFSRLHAFVYADFVGGILMLRILTIGKCDLDLVFCVGRPLRVGRVHELFQQRRIIKLDCLIFLGDICERRYRNGPHLPSSNLGGACIARAMYANTGWQEPSYLEHTAYFSQKQTSAVRSRRHVPAVRALDLPTRRVMDIAYTCSTVRRLIGKLV